MSQSISKVLSKFLNELKHYQNYSISANGESCDWPTKELVERAESLLEPSELADLGRLIETNETARAMELLSYKMTDYYFNQGGEQ